VAEVAYIALGSNLGDRHGYLARARAKLAALADSHIVAESSIDETLPLGDAEQPPYLNQMIALETSLAPERLMAELLRIEREEGRERGERWGSRTLDLDIVEYGDRHIARQDLTIPHPGLRDRGFWQRQLATIKPNS
jgi:2-amino-4-hydroxy-6-hydroxymethyldihydropteridine diphosphokinase